MASMDMAEMAMDVDAGEQGMSEQGMRVPRYPQSPYSQSPSYPHSYPPFSESHTPSPSNGMYYILYITTHAGYDIIKGQNSTYTFKSSFTPINFRHILASIPGILNYTCSDDLSRVFESSIPYLLKLLTSTYGDEKVLQPYTHVVESLKRFDPFSSGSFVSRNTRANDFRGVQYRYGNTEFIGAMERRFMTYKVDKNRRFINKNYSYTDKEVETRNHEKDFGLHLYRFDAKNGLYQYLEDFMKGINYFSLSDILENLHLGGVNDVMIVDLGCSNINLKDEKTGKYVKDINTGRTPGRDQRAIRTAFEESHELEYIEVRPVRPVSSASSGGKLKYNRKNKTKKGRKSKNKNKHKSRKRKTTKNNNNKRKSKK